MSLCLATKGVLCQHPPPSTPVSCFSPILNFDVELVLKKPLCLLIENTDSLGCPAGFTVDDTSVIVSTPVGLFVEGEETIGIPSAFDVEDTSTLAHPVGFSVEDI